MTDGPVVVIGAAEAELASMLARAGRSVVLCEPDLHDRARVADQLRRAGFPNLDIAPDLAACADAALVLTGGPVPPVGGQVVGTDWTRGLAPSIHVSHVPGPSPPWPPT